jgi:glutamine synthetase
VPGGRPGDVERATALSGELSANDSIVTTDVLRSPDGELRLHPDIGQLVVPAGQPGWAWAPVDRVAQDGERHPGCARTYRRRVVTEAAERHGLTFKAAVEVGPG